MTNPIPEGYHTITPSLMVSDAIEAIALYKKAFGAKEEGVMKTPDGKSVMHAVLNIGNSKIFLADMICSGDNTSSKASFYLYVPDVDAAIKQAKEAGLSEKMPATDMFWGDRLGAVQDKFGISWTIATHTRDMSEDEIKKGAEAFAKQMGQAA